MFWRQPSTEALDHHLLCELLPQSPWTWNLIFKEAWHVYLVHLPCNRVTRQNPWYDISCIVHSVGDSTACIAGKVVLELVQHIHFGTGLVFWWQFYPLVSRAYPPLCSNLLCSGVPRLRLSLCVVSQLSAALHSWPPTGFFWGAPCHTSVGLTLYGNKVEGN